MWLLLGGAIPGLLIGTFFLRLVGREAGNPVVVIVLGIVLALSSSITFAPRVQNRGFCAEEFALAAWLALPIGIESGFSSAGAGALGTVLMLNYSEMTPPQVVGTDLVFGLVLAVIGAAFHWKFGAMNSSVLAATAGGRHSRRAAGLRVGSRRAGASIEDGCGGGGDFCGTCS